MTSDGINLKITLNKKLKEELVLLKKIKPQEINNILKKIAPLAVIEVKQFFLEKKWMKLGGFSYPPLSIEWLIRSKKTDPYSFYLNSASGNRLINSISYTVRNCILRIHTTGEYRKIYAKLFTYRPISRDYAWFLYEKIIPYIKYELEKKFGIKFTKKIY